MPIEQSPTILSWTLLTVLILVTALYYEEIVITTARKADALADTLLDAITQHRNRN